MVDFSGKLIKERGDDGESIVKNQYFVWNENWNRPDFFFRFKDNFSLHYFYTFFVSQSKKFVYCLYY
jgi:hypothetical protein